MAPPHLTDADYARAEQMPAPGPARGTRREAFDHARLAATLSSALHGTEPPSHRLAPFPLPGT